jgi:hypothetical protein
MREGKDLKEGGRQNVNVLLQYLDWKGKPFNCSTLRKFGGNPERLVWP